MWLYLWCLHGVHIALFEMEFSSMEEGTLWEAKTKILVKSTYQHKEQLLTTENTQKLTRNLQTYSWEGLHATEELLKVENIIEEALRVLVATFSDEVYDWMPGVFAECVRMAKDKCEKEGFLLLSVTKFGSVLPTVSCRYNRRNYRTNFYYWEKLNLQAEANCEEPKEVKILQYTQSCESIFYHHFGRVYYGDSSSSERGI